MSSAKHYLTYPNQQQEYTQYVEISVRGIPNDAYILCMQKDVKGFGGIQDFCEIDPRGRLGCRGVGTNVSYMYYNIYEISTNIETQLKRAGDENKGLDSPNGPALSENSTSLTVPTLL